MNDTRIYSNGTSMMTVSDIAFVVIRPISNTPMPDEPEDDNGKIKLIQGMFSSPVATATVKVDSLKELLAAIGNDDESITIEVHRIDHPQIGAINAIGVTTPHAQGCLMPVVTKKRKARKR